MVHFARNKLSTNPFPSNFISTKDVMSNAVNDLRCTSCLTKYDSKVANKNYIEITQFVRSWLPEILAKNHKRKILDSHWVRIPPRAYSIILIYSVPIQSSFIVLLYSTPTFFILY